MTIEYLKANIDNIDDSFKIFLSESDNFLALQYAKQISKSKGLDIVYVDSIEEISNSPTSIIFEYSPTLNICITDEFNEYLGDISDYNNCIVICNKINKNIVDSVSEYVINFPVLTDWQIKDYMNIICPGLHEDEINWLYSVTDGNIYRIINELSKVNIFSKSERRKILSDIKNDPQTDLFLFDNFYLANAIMSKNKLNILNFLLLDKCKSIAPLSLVGLLLSECKKILFVKFNSGISIDQIGISEGKRRFIINNYSYLTEDKLKKIIEFLSKIDYRIKSGEIEAPDSALSEYIICTIINYI